MGTALHTSFDAPAWLDWAERELAGLPPSARARRRVAERAAAARAQVARDLADAREQARLWRTRADAAEMGMEHDQPGAVLAWARARSMAENYEAEAAALQVAM